MDSRFRGALESLLHTSRDHIHFLSSISLVKAMSQMARR